MADEKINQDETLEKEPETQAPETEEAAPETPEAAPEAEAPAEADPLQEAQEALKQEHDNYLRLAAEYDNFRKRSQKEKDTLFRDGKASAIEKFLPVYDNLSRALEQETADAAYKKGVEMTMTGLMEILKKLEVTIYGEPGDTFDPALHNAVMHLEDDNYKEGEIVQVFQKGFSLGGKVIRFAMVQTAN
jgi:molecular chaperone GrpE